MNVIISGRHFDVSSELKDQVTSRITELLDIKALKVSTVRVIFEQNSARYSAEIIVNLKHHDFESKIETYDVQESFDTAIDKIEVQVRKYVDKMQEHHKDTPKFTEEVEAEDEEFDMEPIVN